MPAPLPSSSSSSLQPSLGALPGPNNTLNLSSIQPSRDVTRYRLSLERVYCAPTKVVNFQPNKLSGPSLTITFTGRVIALLRKWLLVVLVRPWPSPCNPSPTPPCPPCMRTQNLTVRLVISISKRINLTFQQVDASSTLPSLPSSLITSLTAQVSLLHKQCLVSLYRLAVKLQLTTFCKQKDCEGSV